MNRREMLVATGIAGATALSGCLGVGGQGSSATGQNGSPTVEERSNRRIIVSNSAEVTGEPNLAILDVGVEARGDSAGAVRDELATRSDELRQALLDSGLDEDAITTERFRIHERFDRRQMEEDGVRPDSEEAEEYVFYQGTHSFTVEVDAIDEVGATIDTAVDAGADQVGRVTFTLSDDRREQLREEALSKAIQGARSEAESIAEEVGASVVEATVVDASKGRVSPVHRDVAFEAAAATESPSAEPRTGLEPGDVTVSADVRIQYRIE